MTSEPPAGLPGEFQDSWERSLQCVPESPFRVRQLLRHLAAAEARAAEAERRLRELALKLFPFGCASCQEFHDRIIAALAATEADHAER